MTIINKNMCNNCKFLQNDVITFNMRVINIKGELDIFICYSLMTS